MSLPFLPIDGRQSERALAIARGTLRLLALHDYAGIPEFTLAHGRRADLLALGPKGEIWLIEIKSSVQDFRVDQKWDQYLPYCDRFSFAVGPDFPQDLIPPEVGLIVADKYGAAIIRDGEVATLPGARRKAITTAFARVAARRLHALFDSDPAAIGRAPDEV
jgi:hypothetical protein